MVGTRHFAVLSEFPFYASLLSLNGITKTFVGKVELKNVEKKIFFFP
jgi:hypothetical protein